MLNLISDHWIPVQRDSGPDIIRPDQIADPDVRELAWPRPDLNLACLELLIGLTYLACPPARANRGPAPDAATLRAGLEPLKPAFNLLGNGPRFLQDFDPNLEGSTNPPDMLFIDSAGEATAKKNADLMVRRDRYESIPLPLAAMALYTLQAFAPSGGAGNRTSMRGGGPMVTLVRPRNQGLWPMIWANVPPGAPLEDLTQLPWMRPTKTSEKGTGKPTPPPANLDPGDPPPPEMFFGQPRRLRLVGDKNGITEVMQRPYGTNYQGWLHYLSPYYLDTKMQKLPVHPRPGVFGYRNWRGILLSSEKGINPETLRCYRKGDGDNAELIVAGWAMDNMKPIDFIWSEQPVFPLSDDADLEAGNMVEAAEQAGNALRTALKQAMSKKKGNKLGTSYDGHIASAEEAFFIQTQDEFEKHVDRLSKNQKPDMNSWRKHMRQVAISLFDQHVEPALLTMDIAQAEKAVHARNKLLATFKHLKPEKSE